MSMLDKSILISIKSKIPIEEADECYDEDLIDHINAAFAKLKQLGVGPENGYFIDDKRNLWSEFSNNKTIVSLSKDLIYYTVKLAFDPPTNSFAVSSIKELLKETEWRIKSEAEFYQNEGGE